MDSGPHTIPLGDVDPASPGLVDREATGPVQQPDPLIMRFTVHLHPLLTRVRIDYPLLAALSVKIPLIEMEVGQIQTAWSGTGEHRHLYTLERVQ